MTPQGVGVICTPSALVEVIGGTSGNRKQLPSASTRHGASASTAMITRRSCRLTTWRSTATYVLNRKATLAMGTGWVHGEQHSLDQLLY